MNEERDRLVARIQHFYDHIWHLKDDTDRHYFIAEDIKKKDNFKLLSYAYGKLASEYHKVFDNILYEEEE